MMRYKSARSVLYFQNLVNRLNFKRELNHVKYCHNIHENRAHRSSSLFISNSVAQKTSDFDVHLDFDKLLVKDRGRTLENLRRRNVDFNLDDFCGKFEKYKKFVVEKNEIDNEKKKISEEMKSLMSVEMTDERKNRITELRAKGAELRRKNKEFTQEWWDIEEEVMLTGLWLPNDIDVLTPDVPMILNINKIENSSYLDHVFISQKDGLIKFSNIGRKAYYLFDETAWLEQSLIRYVQRRLESLQFQAMICPDMFRSPVIEGCGLDWINSDETLLIDSDDTNTRHPKINDNVYLSGASLNSIISYLSKTRVDAQNLPMKFFAKGRCYSASAPSVTDDNGLPWAMDPDVMSQHDEELNCLHPSLGLYEALQTSSFHCLSLCENQKDCVTAYNQMIDETWALFIELNLPSRIVRIAADKLHKSERSRTEFQIYSPVLDKYITSAYVSDIGDFASRRLEVLTETCEYCCMCHGCMFDVTKTVASFIENYYDSETKQFLLPEVLEEDRNKNNVS